MSNFDLSFLVLINKADHVEWKNLMHSVIKQASDIIFYGPEARLLSDILIKSFNKHSRKYIKKVQGAFDIERDVIVDSKKALAASSAASTLGEDMWKDVSSHTREIIDATVERAIGFFIKQSSKKKKVDKADKQTAWEAFIASSMTNHVEAYTKTYPDRILHPEIERMVGLAETNPAFGTIERNALKDRLKLIGEKGEAYFKEMSDVQVGRVWNYTGLEVSYQNDVSEYMIVEQMDAKNKPCPVCQALHGQHFSVEASREKVIQVLKETDPEKIKEMQPFPRINEIVAPDMTQDKISKKGYMPPFHGSCRGNVVFLWKKKAVVSDAQKKVLDKIENEIRNLKHEELYVIDQNGKVLFEKIGTRNSIDITDVERKAITSKNAATTHNHPRGSSFSIEDILFSSATQNNTIRAVGNKYNYNMFIDLNFYKLENINEFGAKENAIFHTRIAKLVSKHKEINAKIHKEFVTIINEGKMTIETANATHHHELWSRLSKDKSLHLIYKRTKIK